MVPTEQTPPLDPDDPFVRHWHIPAIGARHPDFPLLPGEDRHRSRSVGDVSYGYLVRARELRFPHPSLAMLERQSVRDLHYTSDAMYEGVVAASRHVQRSHPGAITYLGNFSAMGGGDIPYSVSHNSGRDADIAFFVLDEESGEPFQMRDLLPLDEQGRYLPPAQGEPRSEFASERVLVFDVARNWKLIEGLMQWGALEEAKIQYVFVSDPLKEMLLDHAREVGAEARVIAAADRVLLQPRGALPHNDHFHVRIYCSATDVASGCENTGGRQPGFEDHRSGRDEARKLARAILSGAEQGQSFETLRAALERLALLQSREDASLMERFAAHEEPSVRAAAVRALASVRRGERALIERLDEERHPRVLAEIIVALGDLGGKKSYRALARALEEPLWLDELGEPRAAEERLDGRVLIVDQLAVAEDRAVVEPLIDLLARLNQEAQAGAQQEARVRALGMRAHRALGWLTNQDPLRGAGSSAGGEVVEVSPGRLDAVWQVWWAANKKKRREQWLIDGFREAGFEVTGLERRRVWALCRAIGSRERHLSYNAQRTLMSLFDHRPLSLDWSREDASFYWRRWLERRTRRFRLPRIPTELSTLR